MQAPQADARIVRRTVLRHTVSLGRLNGIRIGVHASWLVVFAFVTIVIATGFTELTGIVAYAVGAICALGLFASVIAHELGHALAGRRFGVGTSSITLFLLGGIALLEDEPATPRADAVIALAGPLTSLVIALGAGGALLLAGRLDLPARIAEPVTVIAAYFGLANLVMAGFNLLPAYPLDGGRLLRALIWRRTADRARATTLAWRIGMGFGVAIVAASVLVCAATHELVFAWYVLIGAFVLGSGWSNERAFQRAARARVKGLAPAA
jgi:Zn-dependent protease